MPYVSVADRSCPRAEVSYEQMRNLELWESWCFYIRNYRGRAACYIGHLSASTPHIITACQQSK
jgi:hypothetical protein